MGTAIEAKQLPLSPRPTALARRRQQERLQAVGATGTGTRSGPPGLGSRSQLPLPPASVLVGGAVQSAAVSVQVFSFTG